MFCLKNRHLGIYREKMVGFGACYGNPKFPEGFPVHTSQILGIVVDREAEELRLHTRSGSCYRAALAELDPGEIETTRETLKCAGMDAELEECLAFGLQRIQEYKELEEWLALGMQRLLEKEEQLENIYFQ